MPFNKTTIFFVWVLFAWSHSQVLHELERAEDSQIDSLKIENDSSSSPPTVSRDTITWQSQRFSYQASKEKFSLFNSAILKYKGAVLKADTIFLDNKTQVVEAVGGPVIKDKAQPEIWGYRLKYNHSKQIGEIYYGTTRRDNQMFNGIEIRRQKSGAIHIARGDFSTCDSLEDQHFYFYCRRMVLEPKKKVMARPVVLNISDVPVAILPMMVIPLGSGRRSGFIRPKIGGDQAQGFYIQDLGYYMMINDYTDAQLKGDLIEGEQGTFDKTNLKGNFIYNKRNKLSGNVNGTAYMNEFNPGNSGWEVNFAHNQKITPDGVQTLTGNGRFVSRTNILDEALNEAEAVNQTANATLAYSNTLDWNRARINVGGYQNYSLTSNMQKREFPNASFAFDAPLFPLKEDDYWRIEPDGEVAEPAWFRKINYGYSGRFNVYSENEIVPNSTAYANDLETYTGAQNALNVSAKYSMFKHISVTPSLSGNHNWNLHSAAGRDGKKEIYFRPEEGRIGNNVYTYNLGVNTSTKLYGIAQPNLGRWEKIRHTLSPTMGFTWFPEIDTNKTFVPHPNLGGQSFQTERRVINFGLGNDVDIKILSRDTAAAKTQESSSPAAEKKSSPYKIMGSSSTISYDFEKDERNWSDINSSFRTEIVKHVPLTLSTRHSLYDDYAPLAMRNKEVFPIATYYGFGWHKDIAVKGKMSSGLLSFRGDSIKTPELHQMPWSANLSYGFTFNATRKSATAFQRTLEHTFSGNMRLNPTPKWELSYNTGYDFRRGEFSKHSFSFNRLLHCWTMKFSWTPVGISQGWNFMIYVNDISDIKIESSKTKLKRNR